MKALKPSARERKRYLFVKGKDLNRNINKAILDFTGTLGMSKTGLIWIETKKDSAIIGVNRESLNNVRASFSIFQEKIIVEKVSGTIKSLGKKS